ncbi:MAG: cytidine deaminase [Thermotogae bacterium]|nr:cytidine deaminase [Thermotogota bacterium]
MMNREALLDLYARALESVGKAYAPFSGFKVGAAALMEDEEGNVRVFTGANVENSSYGLTVCAERVAIFKGVSEGFRKLRAVAVVASKDGEVIPVVPCGACRQVMWEFGDGETLIYNGARTYRLSHLLPDAFKLG